MPRQHTRQHLHRLAGGRCPIHGAPMAQVDVAEDGRTLIVECTQTDCGVRGTRRENEEGVVLLPEFLHLLDPDSPTV
jgi:hypothetical protein